LGGGDGGEGGEGGEGGGGSGGGGEGGEGGGEGGAGGEGGEGGGEGGAGGAGGGADGFGGAIGGGAGGAGGGGGTHAHSVIAALHGSSSNGHMDERRAIWGSRPAAFCVITFLRASAAKVTWPGASMTLPSARCHSDLPFEGW
jgi:hypothetical protein